MENLKYVGKKLKALRGGASRESVANDLNISFSALCAYENGERLPRDEIKLRIAEYYNEPVNKIFTAKLHITCKTK